MASFGFQTEGIELVKEFRDQVKGRTFLITGPSKGGIGAEAAISLAHAQPSTLLLLGRSLERIQPTIDTIHSVNPSITTKFIPGDLSSFSSVRHAASLILNDPSIPQINVIINNAAIMACPYRLTPDGVESQLAANYLGHFLLTNLLMPKILIATKSSSSSIQSQEEATKTQTRIINVSSVANRAAPPPHGIRFFDPNYTQNPQEYTPVSAYGQSKTAAILFTIALNMRFANLGMDIRSWSLNPGSIVTSLGQYMTPQIRQTALKDVFGEDTVKFPERKTLQQGCATTLRAALDRSLGLEEEDDAVYLNDCQITNDPYWVAAWSLDKDSAEKLWGVSEELVGEKFSF